MVATLTLVQDVTANAALLTLLAGPRWAVGPRDLALLGRRAARPVRPAGGRISFDDLREELDAAVSGSDPTEVASLGDALESPGDLDYSAEARERFALLAAELRRLRACGGRADPRPGPPDHRHLRHRRRARLVGQPRGGRAARQPRPLRPGGRRVPGRRRPGDPGRAAGLARGRGRLRPGPRRRHPVRGRLGQAAHRPPGQGPGVGRRVHRRRHRAQVPHRPHPVDLADGAVRDAGSLCGATPATCRCSAGHTPADIAAFLRAHQGARAHRGAPARVRRLDPRRDTAAGLGLVLLAQAQGRSRPVGLPRCHASRR